VDGRVVPLAMGFRNMAVFRGRSDPRPAIYTVANCGSYGKGPVLLRARNGDDFEVVGEPGMGVGDPNVTAFRGTLAFKGRLFTTPAGSRGGQANTSFNAIVLCSDDPAAGRWERSNRQGFGDPTNLGIFDMGVCGNYLYAGTINVRRGCELWRTDAEGPPPHRWTKVFDRGAGRGPYNQLIISLAEFQGDLYVGTGIQNGGHDRFNNIGPAAGEVLCVHPDGAWELVVGEPRLTADGLRVPRSGLGPGFENPFAGYIWRMTAHDGALYVGTYDSSSFLPYADPAGWPEWVKRVLDREGLERYMQARGGCELWRSTDGRTWRPVTRNGFGNPFNWGVRALLSTPRGLFVGTANPFGPQVAVRGPSGWRYEDNPRGGLEIWHGAPEHAGAGDLDCQSAGCLDDMPYLAEAADEDGRFGSLLGACGEAALAAHRRHDTGGELAERERFWRRDPLAPLVESDKELIGLAEEVADEVATYFGGAELRNVGYWRDKAVNPAQASEQLLDELLALLPAGGEPRKVLAVGAAGLASAWQARRPSDTVTAAEGLPLPAGDGAWDVIVWVEGPGAADRPAALAEVRRCLAPGGRLLAADLLGTRPDGPDAPPEPDLLTETYERDLAAAGFGEGRVIDATRETWRRFVRHSREYFGAKLLLQQIDQDRYDSILAALPGGRLAVAAYVLVTATV
jgi:SAM-dependent methyltransferase